MIRANYIELLQIEWFTLRVREGGNPLIKLEKCKIYESPYGKRIRFLLD